MIFNVCYMCCKCGGGDNLIVMVVIKPLYPPIEIVPGLHPADIVFV